MEAEVSSWSARSTYRSSNGCWTCRIRRKKCDEQHPVCDCCNALSLTCHYGDEKPDWMDGGVKQEEMAEYLKRKVKERGHRRLRNAGAATLDGARTTQPQVVVPMLPESDTLDTGLAMASGEPELPCPKPPDKHSRRQASCKFTSIANPRRNSALGQSDDSVLIMFYIDHVFPFLFPFYQPPMTQGGRSWIFDMMMTSPVVRQATLCQSTYFLSLSRSLASDGHPVWETVLTQTREAFGVLRQALQVISGSNIDEHLHGATRVLSSIMQVQRFEVAVSSFENCKPHLNAALALFRQLLDSVGASDHSEFSSNFEAVMYNLGPPSWNFALNGHIPSAEQAGFRFSSTLLIFDDIIASTVLQQEPSLYELHSSMLEDVHGNGPVIDLESVIGCQNWVLVQIGKIAVLDAWKQRCKSNGTLDVMELVRRATVIKKTSEDSLTQMQATAGASSPEPASVFDIFTVNRNLNSQKLPLTLAWAHAALIYLSVVVSGWQPANSEIRYHVSRIIDVLVREISPPALLRAMVWPLSVAACLAEPEPAARLCSVIEGLQPPSIFGTLKAAIEVAKSVWRNGNPEDLANRDLGSCFRAQGDLILLV
ncbi:fungal-specific transcription factor domain-containing protein [Nemania sp. FL0916]|nr:fungal-specific transcription factor domain-containing protein [Nemania sp. FL0916]